MKTKLTIALSFILISNLNAQDSLSVKNYYFEGETTLGYLHSNFSSINSFLTTNGLGSLSRNRFNLGFSSIQIRNKFVFGAGFDMLITTSESQPGNRETRLKGISFGPLLGYIVLQKRNITIYPYIRLYDNSFWLKIIDNQSVADASSLLSVTTRNVSLDYNFPSIDFGLSINKNFSQKNTDWDCPQSHRYLILGLKVGYFFSADHNSGEYNNQILSGTPALGYKGPYIKLSFGFGSRLRQLKWH